ncbi:ribosome assembly RNA-binding protein YhbY [Desulforhopalus sp. IMCC35007]|nr:ribosome assembly RNA-binding protein YhbY [Desulforhopalus sp. IMCC35007]
MFAVSYKEKATNMSDKKKEPVVLNTKQKQYLKGLAHPLNPLVQIGKEGLSPGLLAMTREELLRHELIKVKLSNNSGLDKVATSEEIAEKTESILVQLIGKTFVLYKENLKKPKDKRIYIPKG